MKRIALAGLVTLFAAGCATTDTQRSYAPPVKVVVKSSTKRAPATDYRVSPEDSRLTGSGGSAK